MGRRAAIFDTMLACVQIWLLRRREKKETTKSAQRREFSCFRSHDRYVLIAKILRDFEGASPKKLYANRLERYDL